MHIQTALRYTYTSESKTVLTSYLNDRASGCNDLDIKQKIEDMNPFPLTIGTPSVVKHYSQHNRYVILMTVDNKPVDTIAVELIQVLVAHNRTFALPEIFIDQIDA